MRNRNHILLASVLSIIAASCAFGKSSAQALSPHEMEGEQLLPVEMLGPVEKLAIDNPLRWANTTWPNRQILTEKAIKDKHAYTAEVDRTRYWLELILQSDYRPQSKGQMTLVPNMRRGDDWIITRYFSEDIQIQLIDGRTLTVVLKPVKPQEFRVVRITARSEAPDEEGVVKEPKAEQRATPTITESTKDDKTKETTLIFVHALFRAVFRYDRYMTSDVVPTYIADVKSDLPDTYYGKIRVDRGKRMGWLVDGSISWWSNGKVAVFDFSKLVPPVASKVPSISQAEHYVGGIPYEDERPFKRFGEPKSIDFKAEFSKQFPNSNDNKPKHDPILDDPSYVKSQPYMPN